MLESSYAGEANDFATRLRQNPPPYGSVIFYGSSSIRAWDTLQEDFASVKRPLLNLGFGGSRLDECVTLFDLIVGNVPSPRSLVVYAGENDLGQGRTATQVISAYRDLQAKVTERFGDLPMVYMSVKPSPGRRPLFEAIRETNAGIIVEVAKRPKTHFLDVYAPMLDERGEPRQELWIEDGIHLSRAGYALWTQRLCGDWDFLFA